MHHGGGRDRGCWGPGGTGCRNRMGGTGFQERENREEEQDCVYVYATFLPAPQNIQGLIFRWIIGQWEARQRGGLHCVPQLCRGHMPLLPIAVPLRPSWEDCPLLSPSLKAHICILSHQPWPLSYSKIFSLPSTIAMGEVKLGFVLPHSTWMASIWRVKPRSTGYRYYVLSEHKMLILFLPRTSASPVSTHCFSVYPLKLFEDKEALYPLPRKVPHAKRSFQASF